jgi:hypothetical protein
MYKIHRYIGLLISPLIFVVSITGIFLNHTDRLGLSEKSMPESIVRIFYAEQFFEHTQIMQAGVAFYRDGAGNIYANEKKLGHCSDSLLGVERVADQLIAVCANKLLFFTIDGELLEELGASLGIPPPFHAAQVLDDTLLLVHDAAVWQLSPESLQVSRLGEDTLEQLYQSKVLDREYLLEKNADQHIDFTLERLLLDLHAGRIAGSWGVWLLDLTAVALLLMVVSGFCGWRKRKQSEL